MPRYIAFLRAINVGSHIVKMEQLKKPFVQLGFTSVETFIASGNVIFESAAKDAAVLEVKIEKTLLRDLGYEVKTFLRTDAEVATVAVHEPFTATAAPAESTLYIGFLKTVPDSATEKRLLDAQTFIDEFRIVGRELYWRCRGPSSDSTFSGPKLEKTLAMPTTLRNVNTVRRLATRYAPRSGTN